jgi:hypothetical protein
MTPDNVILGLSLIVIVMVPTILILVNKNQQLRAMNERQAKQIENLLAGKPPLQRPSPPASRSVREGKPATIGGRLRFATGDGGQWDTRPRVTSNERPGYES